MLPISNVNYKHKCKWNDNLILKIIYMHSLVLTENNIYSDINGIRNRVKSILLQAQISELV